MGHNHHTGSCDHHGEKDHHHGQPGHSHGHGHHHHHSFSKNILLAFVLNFSFAIIEVVGGIYTNSMAILSDALHDFGDSTALLLAFFLEKMSHKAPDERYTYGYRRFSVLSALINAFILFVGSLFVIRENIERLMSPEPINPHGTVLLAILGVAVNGFAAFRLSKDEGLNQRAVMLHLMEDIFGWVAVLIVGGILIFKPWYILDPILSLLISCMVIRGVYKNLKKVIAIILQRFPDNLSTQKITEAIQKLRGVCDVHFVQGWSMDESHHTLTLHISVSPEMTVRELDQLKHEVKSLLKTFGVKNSTLEFESSDYTCIENQ